MAKFTLLTEQQAAEFLKIRVKTLQSWRVRGGGPKFVKVGRLVRYRDDDLEQFLAARTFSHTSSID
jgi:excisionase family DNA binding protein